MKTIQITQGLLRQAEIELQAAGLTTLHIGPDGGGLDVSAIAGCTERYLVFDAECLMDHSLILNLNVYEKADDTDAAFYMRFLVCCRACVQGYALTCSAWMGHILFPESYPGQLKVVCHGKRVERVAAESITLAMPACYHSVTLRLSDLTVTDTFPESFPLPNGKRIDSMGSGRKRAGRASCRP